MKLDLYQIDAFTDKIFRGNPACVVPLSHWLPDEVLLNIAKENAVAETAFFIEQDDHFHLRWFTQEIEMDLCGHATLATAHVLTSILKYSKDEMVFKTKSGDLIVTMKNDLYILDFPSRMPIISELPTILKESFNIQPIEVYKSRDYVLIYSTEQDVKNIKVNRNIFDQINLDPGGIIVTAPGDTCDFVSRFFTSQSAILEDQVTGSAHCSLIPLWSQKLNKKQLLAIQLSARRGSLYCEDKVERVFIGGKARTYSIGSLWTE